jgi:hypothetical protein
MPKAGSGRSRTPRAPTLRVISGGQSTRRNRDPETKETGSRHDADRAAKGKRVQFDLETWHALNMLARDRMMTFQELADEAFRDLLHKHGRPTDLKDALKRSLRDTEPRRPVTGKGSTRHHEE